MKVTTRFEKSKFFRTIHADGCEGSITPRGDINCAIYGERFPLPAQTSFEPTSLEAWHEQIEVEEGTGAERIREYEVSLILSIHSALSMHIWLGIKMEQLRKVHGISDEDWERTVAEARVAQHRQAVPDIQTIARIRGH